MANKLSSTLQFSLHHASSLLRKKTHIIRELFSHSTPYNDDLIELLCLIDAERSTFHRDFKVTKQEIKQSKRAKKELKELIENDETLKIKINEHLTSANPALAARIRNIIDIIVHPIIITYLFSITTCYGID